MLKNFKQRAFSLIDAIIILVALAVVIILSTSVFTRKAINIADIGASISGSPHGRVEVFYKEIVKFNKIPLNLNWYEKSSDAIAETDTIIIYERKSDEEHMSLLSKTAEDVKLKNHIKPTLYEEYSKATPVFDAVGNLVSFKFDKNDTQTISIGGKYIAENPSLVYLKTDANGKRTSGELGRDKYRVIEGNLAEKVDKTSPNGNNLWLVDVDVRGNTSEVKSIPWYKMYSGDTLKLDQQLDGETISFDLPLDLKNVQFYGVGGGGTSFPIDTEEAQKATLLLNSATDDDIKKIANDLYERFKELYFEKRNSLSEEDKKILKEVVCNGQAEDDANCFKFDNIIKIHSGKKEANKKPFNDSSEFPLKNHWISINKGDGTISAKFDARVGLVLPHELIEYTKKVGYQTQNATTYQMPKWFSWEDLNNKYCIAASACGTGGENGPNIVWYTRASNEVGGGYGKDFGEHQCFRNGFANNGHPIESTCLDLFDTIVYDEKETPPIPGDQVYNETQRYTYTWECLEYSDGKQDGTYHYNDEANWVTFIKCNPGRHADIARRLCVEKCGKNQRPAQFDHGSFCFCGAGYHENKQSGQCESCGENQYWSGSECKCNKGYYFNLSNRCVAECPTGSSPVDGRCKCNTSEGYVECGNTCFYVPLCTNDSMILDIKTCRCAPPPGYIPFAAKLDLNKNFESEIEETFLSKIKRFFTTKINSPTGYADSTTSSISGTTNSTIEDDEKDRLEGIASPLNMPDELKDKANGVETASLGACTQNLISDHKYESDVVHECADSKDLQYGQVCVAKTKYRHCLKCEANYYRDCKEANHKYAQCRYYNCAQDSKYNYIEGTNVSCQPNDTKADMCKHNKQIILDNVTRERIPHYYRGGFGGKSPGCTTVKVSFNAATSSYTKPVLIKTWKENGTGCKEQKCAGISIEDFNEGVGAKNVYANPDFPLACENLGGKNGDSGYAQIATYKASAIGGRGGGPYKYNYITGALVDDRYYTKEQIEGIEKCLEWRDKPYNHVVSIEQFDRNGKSLGYYLQLTGEVEDFEYAFKTASCGNIQDAKITSYGDHCSSGKYQFDEQLQCLASTVAPANGMDGEGGEAKGDEATCKETLREVGIPKDDSSNIVQGNIYNHIYVWSAPYASNTLLYSEAGKPGESDHKTVPQITGQIEIKLGKGATSPAEKAGKTVVKMKNSTILDLKGGTNSTVAKKAKRYDMCYIEPSAGQQTCALQNNATTTTTCCNNESGAHSTREIIETSSKQSLFETNKGLAGNSTIVGIGLGRAGSGYGTISGDEALDSLRNMYNISYWKNNVGYQAVETKYNSASGMLSNPDKYKNHVLKPAPLSLKGGDGAVIITW